MDDALKRLLTAENTASELVEKAQQDSERLIQSALHDAQQQEERFQARVPELHAAFLEKTDQRANQTVAEMERRFEERLVQLRDAAEAREDIALEAAFRELLGDGGAGTP